MLRVSLIFNLETAVRPEDFWDSFQPYVESIHSFVVRAENMADDEADPHPVSSLEVNVASSIEGQPVTLEIEKYQFDSIFERVMPVEPQPTDSGKENAFYGGN